MGLFLFLLFFVGGIQPTKAPEADCVHPTVAVSVIDVHGTLVPDPTATDFEARVQGKPVKIISVIPDNRPHRIVLIVDTSGSVTGRIGEPPRWVWQMGMALHFFAENRKSVQIASVIFGAGTHEIAPFSLRNTVAEASLREAARGYQYMKKNPDSQMTLKQAVLEGLELLDHASSADSLYVLTSAENYDALTHDAPTMIHELSERNVRLFAILLQKDISVRQRVYQEVLGPQAVTEIAQKSGGAVLAAAEWQDNRVVLATYAEEKATAQETLKKLYQAILRDSLIEIELSSPIEKNGSFDLNLSSLARTKWKHTRIAFPSTIIGCPLGQAYIHN
jgi:hypothetical protein